MCPFCTQACQRLLNPDGQTKRLNCFLGRRREKVKAGTDLPKCGQQPKEFQHEHEKQPPWNTVLPKNVTHPLLVKTIPRILYNPNAH